MSKEKSQIKSKVTKYFPLVGLILLTVILMFYFKENRGDFGELVHKGTNDILAFYTQNLEPLLFETNITNRDVFNFALYQQLPLNKEKNSTIKINTTNEGNFYEIQTLADSSYPSGYENYIQYMNLTPTQKTKLDSILDSYKTRISEAVFINDKNTVAINPRLAGLQKALLTDIISFSRKINETRTNSIMGAQFNNAKIAKAQSMLDKVKKDTSKQFIVIADDTVFASQLKFDSQKLAQRIDSLKQNTAKLREKTSLLKRPEAIAYAPVQPKDFPSILYKIDSNKTNIYPPINMHLENLGWDGSVKHDSLMASLDQMQQKFSNFNFDIKFDSLENALQMSLSAFDNDSSKNMDINFRFDQLGELINKAIQGAVLNNDKSNEDWEKFGEEIDSLAKELVKVSGDTSYFNSEEFQKKMKQLQQKKNKEK